MFFPRHEVVKSRHLVVRGGWFNLHPNDAASTCISRRRSKTTRSHSQQVRGKVVPNLQKIFPCSRWPQLGTTKQWNFACLLVGKTLNSAGKFRTLSGRFLGSSKPGCKAQAQKQGKGEYSLILETFDSNKKFPQLVSIV